LNRSEVKEARVDSIIHNEKSRLLLLEEDRIVIKRQALISLESPF